MSNATIDHKSAKADAKAAKAYAKATRPVYKKKRYWALAVVAVAIVATLANQGGGSDATASSGSDGSSPSAPANKPAAKPVAVKAGTLIKAFEDNELAADKTYGGKTLKVTGVVDKIDTDVWDDSEYILNLTDGGDYEILSASVHGMSQDELSHIKKGQTVTVIADFDDGGDLGVDLKDGHLA